MADLIQNVQEVYKKWESKSNPNRGRTRNVQNNRYSGRKQHPETDSLSKFSRSLQQRNFHRAPPSNTRKYDSLAQFKMAPTVVPHQKLRPFVGIPCAKCFPHSKALIQDKSIYLLGVNNVLHIPYLSLQSLNICCLWNLFKVHSTLPNTSTWDILKSERVKAICDEILTSENSGEESSNAITLEELHEKARKILMTLKSSISFFCVEITGLIVHHYLKKIFSGILVHKGQLEILKTLSKENIPFVYLPLYQSYFDYILVPYILHMNSLNLPFVTVDSDLFTPILGYFFQTLGAIFIARHAIVGKSETSLLYDAVVKSYLVNCLQAGYNIQLFLEDQHSITGKPQTPNTNLLSAIVDSINEGSIDDVYIVPVSVTYETTEENFSAKQLGSNKEGGIFSKFYFLWKILHLHCGYVRANFNQPFSVKEFLDIYQKQSERNYHPQLRQEQKSEESFKAKNVVRDLAIHSFYDATVCTSLMSTHLLAFLLVTQYRKGGTQQQLQISMDWLRSEIQRKKCDLGFTGESLPVIKRAVELLGKDLISIETIEMEWTSSDLENNNVKIKIYTPVVKLPHVLELQYYANAVVPIFLKESILVNALYALVDVDICHFHHCDSRFFVSRERLIQTAVKLSEFLKFEFIIILPCQDIVSALNDTIDSLIEKECLSGLVENECKRGLFMPVINILANKTDFPEERESLNIVLLNRFNRSVYCLLLIQKFQLADALDGLLKSKKKSHALSFDISSDEDECDEMTGQQLRIDLREESIIHLEFLRNVLSPYIESYWLAACSLLQLIDEVKEESIFIQEMQMTAKEKLYKGLLAYEESFSAETLKNALKMFSDRHIIEYHNEDSVRTLCLSESFNCLESVNEVIADIEDFRK